MVRPSRLQTYGLPRQHSLKQPPRCGALKRINFKATSYRKRGPVHTDEVTRLDTLLLLARNRLIGFGEKRDP